MNQPSQTPRAPNMAMGLLIVGLIAGVAGGLLLAGFIPGPEGRDALPDAQLSVDGTNSQATNDDRLIGENTGGTDNSAPRNAPVQIPASGGENNAEPAPDPLASDALRAILERRAAEDSRLRERAILASESPLSPPVTDTAERIRAWREQAMGPSPAQPAQTAAIAGTDGGVRAVPGIASAAGFPPPLAAGSTHLLGRGSVIAAVLETAIDSDLPGLVRARVSRDVYDTLTGSHVLIPRGSQLVGTYGESARGGQRRLFVRWNDLRLPDGTPIDLQNFSTLGADGASGVRGRRSTGLLAALGAAVLFDLAGNATQIITGEQTQEQGDLASLLAGATGNATSRVAERYMSHLIDGGPRFRVKAGAHMNVLVEEDMQLPALSEVR